MDIGWIWLAVSSSFTIYAFYSWRKNADKQWEQLGILGAVVISLLLARLIFIDYLPQAIQSTVGTIVWIAWLPVLIALAVIFMKGRRK
jgi:hypothetical protein